MTFVKGKHKGSAHKSSESNVPFMSMTNLLTALLNELKNEFVTEQSNKHKKMRHRIKQTIDLISSYSEISSLVIKGNPFKRVLKPGASGTSQRTVSSNKTAQSPGVGGNTLPQIAQKIDGSPRDSSVENAAVEV